MEIQYVSDSLKKDIVVVLKAYEGDDEVLEFIDKKLAVLIERIDSIGNLKKVSKIFFKSWEIIINNIKIIFLKY